MRTAFCFILLSLCTYANAQDSLYFVSATTGAACQEVEYYNGYLFTGTGSTFRVYDVTQPIPYPVLFEYRYRSFLADFRIKGQYLYIAANNDGVSKWDISDPASPFEVARYEPTETGIAAHYLSFFGDTIFVAANKKVILLQDAPASLTKIGELGLTATGGFISGGEIKDTIYACALGRNGNDDGVYIFDACTLSQISYFQQLYADPENVVFGQNNNLVHILGGTQSYSNPVDGNGVFYSLDITDPSNPQMVYLDTINGIPLAAVANAVYGLNINDTIYVVTTAAPVPGWVYPMPAYGQIYVYDATNPADIHFMTSLDAGLWSFDVAINNKIAYIASEWYGIKTLDITDIMNEIDQGNTITGGWAEDADKYGNLVVLANEGYGFKLFDITDPHNPVLSNVNYDPGFCYRTRFSHDGNFIYTAHSTYDGFRIYNTSDLTLVSSLPNLRCNGRMLVWNNYVVSDYEDILGKHFDLTDVSNPLSPAVLQTLNISVNDMVVNDNGIVFVANNDSILVYDISAGSFMKKVSVPFQNIFQDATSICEINDTVYSFITWKGLVKYTYNETAGTLTENSTYALPKGEPQRITADDKAIYFAYSKFGLYAFSKNTMQQLAYYRTGLDLKSFTNQWGVTDLSCKDGYILLTEYFGQLTLLRTDTFFTAIHLPEIPGKTSLVFPNPFSEITTLKFSNQFNTEYSLDIRDVTGRVVSSISGIRTDKVEIKRDQLKSGLYFYSLKNGNEVIETGKLLIER